MVIDRLDDLNIVALIAQIKTIAHEELLPRFGQVHYNLKSDGSLVTEADLAVQARLATFLANNFPDYALLSEEMTERQQRSCLEATELTYWCLDPLDGTTNFAAGLPFFSISLALIDDDGVVLGIVYDPVRDECFSAIRSRGAFLNGQPLVCDAAQGELSETVAVIDFKRLELSLASALVTQAPYRSQRNLGSVALEWCWLAANRYHLYLHGKQHLWDFCAGSLILSEAGGCSATLDGGEVFQPGELARSVVAASDEPLFTLWCEWLARKR